MQTLRVRARGIPLASLRKAGAGRPRGGKAQRRAAVRGRFPEVLGPLGPEGGRHGGARFFIDRVVLHQGIGRFRGIRRLRGGENHFVLPWLGGYPSRIHGDEVMRAAEPPFRPFGPPGNHRDAAEEQPSPDPVKLEQVSVIDA